MEILLSMANPIKPKRSYTTTTVPSGLSSGELAVNAADGKIWIGSSDGKSNVLISSLSLSDMAGSSTNITEGSNLYYTDSRSRLSLSAGTGISYNNTTGVITNSSPDQNVTLTAGTGISITGTYPSFTVTNSSISSGGTVTSVGCTVPTGMKVTGVPITSSGTIALAMDTGYALPTSASQTNWDSAYSERRQWDGGSTNLTASTGRTSLGATTVGSNFFTLTNPSSITFPRINADNTVSTLDASTFRTAIGAGTASSKSDIGLSNVENTALSTWAGSTNLTTIGAATASNTFAITDSSTGYFSSGYSTFKVSATGGKTNDLLSSISDVHFNLNRTVTNTYVGGVNVSASQYAVRITPPTYSASTGFGISKYPASLHIDSAPIVTGGGGGYPVALSILTGSGTSRGLLIQGGASQSTNLMEVYDNSWNLISAIDEKGRSVVSGSLTVQKTIAVPGIYASESGSIKLRGTGSNLNSVGFQAPATFSSSVLWTLPSTDGTSGQVLSTDGNKTLSWVSAGTVTSVIAGSYLTGGTITTTGTIAVDATSANTASKIVARDASGNFSAGTITATLSGKASTVTTNANLTGVITSVGNATSIASQTGTGSKFVVDTSPTLITPTLGVATATSINKVTITTPATGSTLTVADGKTLTTSNTLTFTGTDASSIDFGSGGTVLYSGGALGTPASGTLTNCTFPILNQNTSGTAAGLSTTLAISSGGTGQTTQQAAINALAGAVTSGYFLRGNGTNVLMAALTSSDVTTALGYTPASSSSSSGATTLLGGTPGSIPYTNWEGATDFLPAGQKGQTIISNGTAEPQWSSAPSASASIFLANNFGGF